MHSIAAVCASQSYSVKDTMLGVLVGIFFACVVSLMLKANPPKK